MPKRSEKNRRSEIVAMTKEKQDQNKKEEANKKEEKLRLRLLRRQHRSTKPRIIRIQKY